MTFHLSWSSKFWTLAILGLIVTGCGQDKSDDSDNNQTAGRTLDYTREVTFLNNAGEPITTVEVAVADDNTERNTGLMDVNNLPADKGMLFIFEDEQPRSFWMANTPLSLDIIFVNADMEIVRIHQNTQPFTENNFESGQPAKYVVEVNASFCVSHDIQEGMHIQF